jgi:outer membrane protein
MCVRELADGRGLVRRRLRGAKTASLSFIVAIAAASTAAAQEGIPAPTVFGWTLDSVRAGVRYAPDYIGSDDYRAWFTGAVVLSRHDTSPEPFGAPDDGVSLGLVGAGPLTAGVVGRWRSSRDNDNDLRGFDKIDGTVEGGVFVNWWPADWMRVRAEARHGFGGHDSWVGDFGADAIVRADPWVLTAGPRLGWGDASFTRKYFEVTPLEASRSPLGIQSFSPSGATWSPGAVVSAEYRLNPRWSLESVGSYRRITGDAADSPIVAGLGSRDQFSVSLSVRYTLGQ